MYTVGWPWLSDLKARPQDVDGFASVDVYGFAAFGTKSNLAFDFDGGGSVDALDFGQFRQRFGTSV